MRTFCFGQDATVPNHPCTFDLPNDWITEAGLPVAARATIKAAFV